MSFTTLGVTDLPLVKTSRGHLAVDLLDFDHAALPDDTSAEQTLATSVDETSGTTTSGEQGWTLITTTAGDGTLQTVSGEVGSSTGAEYMTQEEIYQMQDLCLGGAPEEPAVPEGWNPDDWNDHLDHLHALRLDVESWGGGRDKEHDGFLTEGVTENMNYFDEAMLMTPHAFRKVTNKKGKKLSSAVDSDDFVFRRALSGKAQVPNKPHVGRTWVKQLYGLGVGLSLLCVLAGMAVATLPDAGEPEANFNYKVKRHLHNDFQVEDPYVTVACLPLPFSMAPDRRGACPCQAACDIGGTQRMEPYSRPL